jgi:hypothetical protein
MWVNILENQVMWRNLETGVTDVRAHKVEKF